MTAHSVLPTLHCPWCGSWDRATGSDDLKQHFRAHMYDDLVAHNISKNEASQQRQHQLLNYLNNLLTT